MSEIAQLFGAALIAFPFAIVLALPFLVMQTFILRRFGLAVSLLPTSIVAGWLAVAGHGFARQCSELGTAAEAAQSSPACTSFADEFVIALTPFVSIEIAALGLLLPGLEYLKRQYRNHTVAGSQKGRVPDLTHKSISATLRRPT